MLINTKFKLNLLKNQNKILEKINLEILILDDNILNFFYFFSYYLNYKIFIKEKNFIIIIFNNIKSFLSLFSLLKFYNFLKLKQVTNFKNFSKADLTILMENNILKEEDFNMLIEDINFPSGMLSLKKGLKYKSQNLGKLFQKNNNFNEFFFSKKKILF